jgi:hypothetical protein
MSRESFRESIFNVVECLTAHPLYDNGKKLVIHYFNQADGNDAYERALLAIEKYYPESLPAGGERSARLEKFLDELRTEATMWDNDEE